MSERLSAGPLNKTKLATGIAALALASGCGLNGDEVPFNTETIPPQGQTYGLAERHRNNLVNAWTQLANLATRVGDAQTAAGLPQEVQVDHVQPSILAEEGCEQGMIRVRGLEVVTFDACAEQPGASLSLKVIPRVTMNGGVAWNAGDMRLTIKYERVQGVQGLEAHYEEADGGDVFSANSASAPGQWTEIGEAREDMAKIAQQKICKTPRANIQPECQSVPA